MTTEARTECRREDSLREIEAQRWERIAKLCGAWVRMLRRCRCWATWQKSVTHNLQARAQDRQSCFRRWNARLLQRASLQALIPSAGSPGPRQRVQSGTLDAASLRDRHATRPPGPRGHVCGGARLLWALIYEAIAPIWTE